MYPCVILSRCFWQHTSEIHSEGALITAGLRFPPFMCPAETFSPRQQRLSIQPRRRLLLPLAAPAAGAVNKRWLSLSWLWANEVRASDKDAELCNDESDKYPEVGAAGQRRRGRYRPALCGGFTEKERRADERARSGRGENPVRSHPPNHSALPSRTPCSREHYNADWMHYPTQSPGWSHRTEACGVAVVRGNFSSSSSLLLAQDLCLSPACASPQLQRQRS